MRLCNANAVVDATKRWLFRNGSVLFRPSSSSGSSGGGPDVSAAAQTSIHYNTAQDFFDAQPQQPGDAGDPLFPTTAAVQQPLNPRCMKVAVVGMPNAGKSTLINRLVGSQVSAVSPKVQTTRERVLAVLSEGRSS